MGETVGRRLPTCPLSPPSPLSHVVTPPKTSLLLDRLRAATLGRYDIYAELGQGGMATVFLALDLALDRKVTIRSWHSSS